MATVPLTGAPQRDATLALWERYHASVYRYALSQVRSPQDAEDATQNTFLRAFAALQRGVVPENEAAWLFKIAHNVCVSSKLAWLRRRRVETPRDLDALPVEPSAPELHRDELVGLDDALAVMPPRMREAFLLREWQGLSYDEIAARLDTSRSAVESLIFRSRRMLAAQLESPLQRVRQALGLGPLLGVLRGLFGGGSLAVKAGALAVVVAAGAGATIAVQPSHRPAPTAPLRPAAAPTRGSHPARFASLPAKHLAPNVPAPSVPAPSRRASPSAPAAATPLQSSAPAAGAGQASTPAPQTATPALPAAATAPPPPGLGPITTPQPPAAVDPQTALAGASTVPAVPALPAAPAVPAPPSLPAVPAVTLPQPPLP